MELLVFVIGALAAVVGSSFYFRRKYEPQLQAARESNIVLETEKKALEERVEQHKRDLAEMQEKLRLQFENLANRIFDEKSSTFKTQSEKNLSQLLNPLRERLTEFQKKVDESFSVEAKERFALKAEIERIVQVNKQMTAQTENLTNALKGDVKAQGDWGEVVLEKILEESGLRKDKDYILQGKGMQLKHPETGAVQRPDVIVNLPDAKHVIIDSKVSLEHYRRLCDEDEEEQQAALLKLYLASVRSHVSGLAERRYQDTENLGTPEIVLMFMPIEGALSLALQSDRELHSYAWDRRIVIVSPTTLFATLKTIASMWRLELQNQNARDIAKRGGDLYDKFVNFIEDMQKLGSQLNTAQGTYHGAMKKLEGRNNLVRQVERLRELGAKTSKKMPVGIE